MLIGHLVEDLGQLGGVVLADGEDDGLADLATDRVAQGVFQEGLAEERLVASEKNCFSKSRCLKASSSSSPLIVGERDGEALLGQEFGGDLGAGIHDGGVDQKAVLHAVEQRVAKGGLAALAAKGAVGVQQQAALSFARVRLVALALSKLLQIIPGRGREAEFIAEKYSNTARALPPMERWASSEMTRSKSVGENRRWYLLLKSSDCTVVTTISALRQSSRFSL